MCSSWHQETPNPGGEGTAGLLSETRVLKTVPGLTRKSAEALPPPTTQASSQEFVCRQRNQSNWVWGHASTIPALRRLRQEDC